jgi:hypothetical protein
VQHQIFKNLLNMSKLFLLFFFHSLTFDIFLLLFKLHQSLDICFAFFIEDNVFHVLQFENVKCFENDKHFLLVINFIALLYMSENNQNSKPQNINIIYIDF